MWFYLFILIIGVVVGMVIYLKIDGPDAVYNDNTRIGKMKQRGQGNTADVTVDPEGEVPAVPATRKEARLLRRLSRLKSREGMKE
jgi:hypothetical protein